MNDHRTAVLVVGGGITGLSTALFLARHGVVATLVERHPGTAIMPQARAFNPRTMEIYRSLGLEEEIRARTSILADLPEMIGADTLTGRERFRVDTLAHVRPSSSLSPVDWGLVDQDELEVVVRSAAERAGADVRFGTELVSFEVGEDGVLAVVRGGDGEYRVHADHLVAADGNRAGVRRRLGIGADGPGTLGHAAHFLFDADLEDVLGDRRFLLPYLDQPTGGTVLAPLRKAGRWMLGVPCESVEDFTEERCVEAVRSAVGKADLDVALVPPVAGWGNGPMDVRLGGAVARKYRDGRVFFVGDAAHVFPPTGSYGASTGIADAHNLAWKLAAVLHGWGEDALLDTYEDERRPVAQVTLEQSMRLLTARHAGTADDIEAVDDLSMIFGYRYGSTDGVVEDPRKPGGRPGTRAPHVWLERGGARLSTIDLFTGDFVVLAGPDGADWVEAARTASLDAYRVGGDLHDPEGRFPAAYGVSASGVSLVRPDGFVAWRAEAGLPRPGHALREALTRLGVRPWAR